MNIRNILWNLLGLGLPLLFALIAVPTLLANVGIEKFGFLGLAWGLVGYASILDLGMSRALTQKLALNRDTQEEANAHSIVKSAVFLTTLISLVFFVAMVSLSFIGLDKFISYDSTTPREIELSLIILALTLPLQAVSLAYKGINEAYLNFRGISLVRIFLGVANFGAPCIVSLWTTQLHLLVLTLLIARLIAFLAYYHLSRACLPSHQGNSVGLDFAHTKELFRFGKWVALSGMLQPALTQSDRYLIGALLSATAVGQYVVPYEISMQSLVLMGAVTTVAFPAMSHLARSDPQGARTLFRYWSLRMAALMLMMMGALAVAMPALLHLWVGENATDSAILAGRILCAGAFAHAYGSIHTSYIHARGKTRITALFHLVELPIYLGFLFFAVERFGIVGAALGWSCRATVDTVLLMVATRRLLEK